MEKPEPKKTPERWHKHLVKFEDFTGVKVDKKTIVYGKVEAFTWLILDKKPLYLVKNDEN